MSIIKRILKKKLSKHVLVIMIKKSIMETNEVSVPFLWILFVEKYEELEMYK